MGLSSIKVTPGSGPDVVTYTDAINAYHPTGLMEFLVGTTPTIVSAGNPLPVTITGTPSVSVSGSVAVTGTFWQATQPVSASSLPLPTGAATEATLGTLSGKITACDTAHVAITSALPSGANTIGAVTISGTPSISGTVTANAGTGTFAVSGTITANAGSGTMAVSAASLPLPSGAATAAKQPALGTAGTASSDVLTIQGIASMTPVTVSVSGTPNVAVPAATSGGASGYKYLAAASSNQDSQVVKASAGQIYGISLYNTTASSARYVKFYDKSTSPTSADTPIAVHYVPAGGGVAKGFPVGLAFSSGISFRITGGIADNDATAVTANDVIVNLTYK